ncbi:syndecan-2-like [Acipenser oxyrinchus oxyrinchus]|uniref:Syndecan n=1 Tax=Acipenser oxyrinchus oxyrinchus TaxID=40147 RepID=A0AAD8GE24_ACIOX|nr:syndecan-2-like [Acipenser oxyrinchus oxyrinchus]
MRNVWIIFTLGLVTFLLGEMTLAASQGQNSPDEKDLYLEDGSGDYPVDDDDFNSGSGSGLEVELEEPITVKTQMFPKAQPTRDSTKVFTPKVETSTAKARMLPKNPARTEPPVLVTGTDVNIEDLTSATSKPKVSGSGVDTNVSAEIQSESLFQRTEVLAAVIAGGVIGFLFAIFLILLLVYRMRKKDEGSYDLGERKPSSAAYQKAPTKEFYA